MIWRILAVIHLPGVLLPKVPQWGKLLYLTKIFLCLVNSTGALASFINAHPRHWSTFLAACTAFLLSLLFIPCVHLEHYKKVRGSFTISFISLISVFLDGLRTRSFAKVNLYSAYPIFSIAFTTSFVSRFFLFWSEEVKKRKLCLDPLQCSEAYAGLVNRALHGSTSAMVYRGAFKPLHLADLDILPKELESDYLYAKFSRYWIQHTAGKSVELLTKEKILLKTMWHTLKAEILNVIFLEMIHSACASCVFVAQIVFLNWLVGSDRKEGGYWLFFFWTVSSLVGTLVFTQREKAQGRLMVSHFTSYPSDITKGIQVAIRGALVEAIIKKTMKAHISTIMKVGQGKASSLITVDIIRIADCVLIFAM